MTFMLWVSFVILVEPTCANAWWSHMHRFASVCLSVCLWLDRNSLDNNSYCIGHEIWMTQRWTGNEIKVKVPWVKVKGHLGWGQRSLWSKSGKMLKILAGGLTSMSSCILLNLSSLMSYLGREHNSMENIEGLSWGGPARWWGESCEGI